MEARGFGEFQSHTSSSYFYIYERPGFSGRLLLSGKKKKISGKIRSSCSPFGLPTDCSNCTLGHIMVMLLYIISIMYEVNIECVVLRK